ncbi:hypothetical protein GCM10007424_24930 [Flavobacterium suaedae]|uniref:Uncharacterized protein n=1 Tax=Flavobacterium suaedae TaxID=1767027 RepID=A0ABQ1K281_9FLAO|nr:hypothetical protein [Flavobacterium suaedae]GGB83938.1 hypothetical protein GCM10007424_24930 [Flavobacterium suaedae]
MITVNSFTDKRFILNGVEYFRNYITRIAGNKLIIYNVYDNKDVLIPFTEYSQFTVNGTSYNSIEELQSAIMSICYDRTTLGEGGVFDHNNRARVISVGHTEIAGVDTTADSTNYRYSVAQKMSENPFTITATETPVIVYAVITVNDTPRLYSYFFLSGKGTYTSVDYDQLRFINYETYTSEDVENTPGTSIIDLGELTDGDYLNAANSTQRDFTLSGQLDEEGNVISYYFSYTQNEVLYFVQFVGTPSIYNGDLAESDLVSSTNSNLIPDTTLQQITDNGNITTNNIEVKGITVNDGTASNVLLLSGTEAGKPITGDIEFENTLNGTKKIIAKYEDGYYNNLIKSIEFLDEDNFVLSNKDNNSGTEVKLEFTPNDINFSAINSFGNSTSVGIANGEGLYNSSVTISSSIPNSKGLSGNQDFTANITALDYVQKKYIDDIPFIELDETSPQTINKVWVGTLAEYEALTSENSGTLYLKEGVSETGWGKYSDSQYTSGTPFSITADTDTIVPNNSNLVNENQLPTDVATFTELIDSVASGLSYDYSKILGGENDNLSIDINLKSIPTDASASYIELWFNDGSGQENKHMFTFPKGMGEVRHINLSIAAILSSDWDVNGGTLYARCNGSCNIYDISWSVSRIHKAI